MKIASSYDVALFYLKQSNYDLDAAVECYLGDEAWEKDNPATTSSRPSKKQNASRWKRGIMTGLTGQI